MAVQDGIVRLRSDAGPTGVWTGVVLTSLACSAIITLLNFDVGLTRLFPRSIHTVDDISSDEIRQGWRLPTVELVAVSKNVRKLLTVDYVRSSKNVTLHWLTPEQVRQTLQYLPVTDCDHVTNVGDLKYLASGWTKVVYRGTVSGSQGGHVAVKMVDVSGHDLKRCMEQRGGVGNMDKCASKAEEKLLKEAFILNALDNQHIIKLLGICVPHDVSNDIIRSSSNNNSLVTMITELGDNVDIIRLLQQSWEDRLRISHGVTSLLHYLSHNPYGSVVLNDFRRQQFVIVDGELKLSDVDDVGFGEQYCVTTDDCTRHFSTTNISISVHCKDSVCDGLNERTNIINAGRHFISVLLPHGAPSLIRPLVSNIVDAFNSATLGTDELLQLMSKVVEMYAGGQYLQRPSGPVLTTYSELLSSDLPGLFDYRCRYLIAATVCTIAVFDLKEAEDLCDYDEHCRAFVLSNQTTWTGRLIVHLKNNMMSTPFVNDNMRLYVKP